MRLLNNVAIGRLSIPDKWVSYRMIGISMWAGRNVGRNLVYIINEGRKVGREKMKALRPAAGIEF